MSQEISKQVVSIRLFLDFPIEVSFNNINNMKIAITGHTQGFGSFVYNKLKEKNTIEGFSRSNGYDITLPSGRNNIIEQTRKFDIFINNAQQGFSQTELLYELYREWQNLDKMIINIGSNARDFTNSSKIYDYSVQKQALNLASKQLGRLGTCKVTTLDFGYLTRQVGSTIGYETAYKYLEISLSSWKEKSRLLEILVAHE